MNIYKLWHKQLLELQRAYSQICEDVVFIKEPVATTQEIQELEKKLGCVLPESLKKTFLAFSKDISFCAFLPDEFKLPDELREIFSAQFTISLTEVLEAEESRRSWVQACFSDINDPYDKVWHNKLGLMTVANGDVIAFDLEDANNEKRVVYLSHDDGSGHGYVLGNSFQEYFSKLLLIGGCGNEDWQMEPFIEDAQSGIKTDCENALLYRELIGLKLPIYK